jgi:peptidoglycan/LPS O-acetylase OafA/YrhL
MISTLKRWGNIAVKKESTAKRYFQNLDGLRFILALIVFFGHSMAGEVLIEVSPFDFLDRMIAVFSSGALAVSFFFTLSGYLITYLIIEEKENTGSFSVRNFYVRRILRIWPLYYAILFFSFFIYPWVKVHLGYLDQNPFRLAYQAFFLSNFDNIAVDNAGLIGVAPMMISINWSIAIEEQFYLFWPLLFFVIGATRFWIVIVFVIILSWFFRTFLLDGPELYYHTCAVISDLGVGALFAYLSFYSISFVKRMGSMHPIVIILVYVCGFYFLLYPENFYAIHAAYRVLSAVFFAFIILEQNFSRRSFYKLRNSAFMTSLGKYTYSFYLIHSIGIQVAIISFRFLDWHREDAVFYALLYVLIAFVTTMLLSLISYRYVESFFLGMKHRFYSPAR